MKGKSFLYCHQSRAVATSLLVPDLAMSELDAIRIPYTALNLDILIGEGGAAQVYKGTWTEGQEEGRGRVVAIKKLKVMNDSASIDVITDVNISKAFDEFRRECWVMRYIISNPHLSTIPIITTIISTISTIPAAITTILNSYMLSNFNITF
jgi:serine/threonine protein kinase